MGESRKKWTLKKSQSPEVDQGPWDAEELLDQYNEGRIQLDDRVVDSAGRESTFHEWHRQFRLDSIEAGELVQGLNSRRPRPKAPTFEKARQSSELTASLPPAPVVMNSSRAQPWVWVVGVLVLASVAWVVSSGALRSGPNVVNGEAGQKRTQSDPPKTRSTPLRPRVDASAIRVPPRREEPRPSSPSNQEPVESESSNPISYPEQLPSAAPEVAPDNASENSGEPNPEAVIGEETPNSDSASQGDSETGPAPNPEAE